MSELTHTVEALLFVASEPLSVAEIAEAGGISGRLFGLHVFNPVEKMALVELSFPPAASRASSSRTC